MHRLIHRRALLQAGLALGASVLAGPTRACEYFGSNLRITHPWTRASAALATSAIVCMRFDEVSLSDRLIGVQTPVASGAEMVGAELDGAELDGAELDAADLDAAYAGAPLNLLIPAGQETVLGESGTCLRLTGLKFPLEVARSYPLQLMFEKSGVVEARLNVDYSRFL